MPPMMDFRPLRALFSERDYVVYICGTAISLTGTWVQRITIAWLVWEMTGSALWVGIAASADLLPTLAGALYGGLLADRLNRLRLLLVCQLVCAALLCGLALIYAFDALTLALVIGMRVCLSGCIALAHPARMVLLVDLVGRGNLNAAVSFGSVVFNVARALGPALAGVLIAAGGLALALVVNAATFVAMAVSILLIRRRTPAVVRPASDGHGALREIVLGWRYIAAHRAMRTMFSIYVAYVLVARAIEDQLPAFIETLFAVGVQNLALLISVFGIGSIVGGLVASGRSRDGLADAMALSGLLQSASLLGLALSPNFGAACVWIFLVGLFTVQFGTAAQTLVQSSAEDAMRGRVMSLWFVIMRGGPGLGALGLGGLGEVLGIRGAYLVGAVLCMLLFLWVRSRRRDLAQALATGLD